MADKLTLSVLEGRLAVCRLAADADVPSWARQARFSSVTRTPDELSVVVAESAVPEGVRRESGWRAVKVAGPLDFALTGVLADLSATLAAAEIPIFVVSTYDTDYVLVREHDLERATIALRSTGTDLRSERGQT